MSAIGAQLPRSAKVPWGTLPAEIKVLFITTLHHKAARLTEAFAADSAVHIALEEAIGITAGMARLREEVFDAIMVTYEPGVLDALELIEGLRASGMDEPVIVLGSQSEADLAALCFEVGADGYCSLCTTTTRSLIWTFARAIERHQLIRENRRLVQADRQRLQYEHQEAQRLLDQQRVLVADLKRLQPAPTPSNIEAANAPEQSPARAAQRAAGAAQQDAPCSAGRQEDSDMQPPLFPLPCELVQHYREMLRTYVIMGSGNLIEEMNRLAELLASAEVTAEQTMQLHVQVLEELIEGLGNRSARHVMNRADLLVLEVMIHLCQRYRQRYLHRVRPPQQLSLPGFEQQAGLPASEQVS